MGLGDPFVIIIIIIIIWFPALLWVSYNPLIFTQGRLWLYAFRY